MNQRTHSWIAIRSIALLEDEGVEKNLVKLLKPFARQASVGAWIPDQIDAKRGGSATENHILKMMPYTGNQKYRFTTQKAELLKHVGAHRKIYGLLYADSHLETQWWNSPYKGDVSKPGQHLPNRVTALGTMLKDLLLMGSKTIDSLIPGDVRFAQYLEDDIRTHEAAAATYFFMISHFIADASMPCHCDGRKLASYGEGLHKELEGHWSKKVGTSFEKKKLLGDGTNITPKETLQKARDIDGKFGLDFKCVKIPDLQPDHDIWLEVMYLCRASFALASIIASYKQYAYDDEDVQAPFETVLGSGNKELLDKVNEIAMYDAVLNTAIIWKHLWNKVSAS